MIKSSGNPLSQQSKPLSIAELAGGPELKELEERDFFMPEIQIFYELYRQKILEKDDRKRIDDFKKNSIKGFLLVNAFAGGLNRLLTILKYGRLDFMNLHFLPRLLIRLSIFSLLNANLIAYHTHNLIKIRQILNEKYIPRYQEYLRTGGHPMVILNKNYLNDPDITQEEKDMYMKFPKMTPGQLK